MTKELSSKNHLDFHEIYKIIIDAKETAWHQVNTTLIKLYWTVGEYISRKFELDGWGKGVVDELSNYVLAQESGIKGFSARNIWRMKQFYEAYKGQEKLSAVLTEISWTNHLHILSKTKTIEEKVFYLELASKHPYSERAFARLIDSATYERALLADKTAPIAIKDFPGQTKGVFKDSYFFEFLGLPKEHKEDDLRKALLRNFKLFLLEMGYDFSLIGEEYVVQVGMKDFRIDLLMHHRGLNCLVAIELKVTEFQPEHLGKLQFYLEALDHDVKKPHENPSIGILICKTKDDEVVKYALNRNVSPAMIAEYETKLIDKRLLQKKLHELLIESEDQLDDEKCSMEVR
ncbi:MAG: DUF1016 family protein [Proteobacteria bacterium]|nr:DUF1016 family protein [Pseudomonadota bacterium]